MCLTEVNLCLSSLLKCCFSLLAKQRCSSLDNATLRHTDFQSGGKGINKDRNSLFSVFTRFIASSCIFSPTIQVAVYIHVCPKCVDNFIIEAWILELSPTCFFCEVTVTFDPQILISSFLRPGWCLSEAWTRKYMQAFIFRLVVSKGTELFSIIVIRLHTAPSADTKGLFLLSLLFSHMQ